MGSLRGGAVACVAALAVAGCTTAPDPAPVRESPTVDNAADPCTLLTSDEVTEQLRGEPAEPKAEKPQGRPTCTWETRDARYEVRLMMWHPPDPAVQRAHDRMDVAHRPGHVAETSANSCLLDIELDDRWMQVETRTPPAKDTATVTDDLGCQRAARLASQAMARL
jgi:uncharacterized protein DUF3558